MQSFLYDRFGNRRIDPASWGTGINTKQFTVDTANNRLGVPSGQSGTMSYDSAGNLSTDSYTGVGNRWYDAENRMISAQGGPQANYQSYSYDANGQRIIRTVEGVATWQIYGFDGELLAEYVANGASPYPQKEYGYRNGQLLITASSGPSGHWKLNENSGTTAFDSSGNGNTGTLISGPSWVTGQYGSALSLDGVDDYVKIKDGRISTSTVGTVSAWVKVNTLANAPKIMAYGGASAGSVQGLFALEVRQDGSNYYFSVISVPTDSSTIVNSARGNTVVQTGVWYHLALTSDGSTWRLYVNGVAETMTNQLGNGNTGRWFGNTTAASPDKTYIGACRFNGSDSGFIHAVIDDVRIYERALIAGEVATLASSSGSAEIQWLVADHLGTPRMIFDKTGWLTNVKRHDYLPFGEELFAGVGGRTTANGYSGDLVRQKFTRKERDIETGLDYFLARYYSSAQGRFTSADPLMASGKPGIPQSWNRYTYCINNPLILVDPTGMIWGYQDFTENGKKLRRYVWFEGKKVGKGFTAFTPDKDGSIIALKDGNYARLYRQGTYNLIAGAPKITISGQERLNAAAGMFDGAVPFGRQLREAALGGPGGVDTDSAEYENASTISEGVSAGTLLLTGVGPAKLSDEAIGLTKQLASEAQVAELLTGGGTAIAGAGSRVALRDAPRLAAEYGGSVGEWAKIRSFSYKAADGARIEVHAYRNVSTGRVVELKTKLQ